ncbi:unnamed protein product [Cochlearia groenlandica]
MEVISCLNSQTEAPGDIVMDELVLEETKDSELLLKLSETDDLNTGLAINSEETKPFGDNNGEEVVSVAPIEPKWLQQDEPIALWVKWRGKWQAGIRCAIADCPLSTLRGKPTHDRKEYFVVFFPHTKNYSWADMQLVRSIDELPDPIAYKSHKIGVKLVRDLTAARRYIMRKLTVRMFKIVDQFHSEVVIEEAKDIIVWKEFAMEATRSTSYHNLGTTLEKLHSMILQKYIDPIWLEQSFPSWVQRCRKAVNAESIEVLNEELYNSIQWNQVKSGSVSPTVLSEWKTWKQDIRKWFSISRHSVGETAAQEKEEASRTVFNSDVQTSRKRPKLEIRRAETTNASQSDTSPQGLTTIDLEFLSRRDNTDTPMNVMKDKTAVMNTTPENGLDLWDGIVVEHPKEANEWSQPQVPVVPKRMFISGNKSQQCTAFIESKGRQCVRWANEGDVYCCVHLASRFAAKSKKNNNEGPSSSSAAAETPMCGGVTVLGTNCKHRSLPGSLFCKKHRTEKPSNSSFSPFPVKRKAVAEIMSTLEPTTQCRDLVPFVKPEESPSFERSGTSFFAEMLNRCSSSHYDNFCVGSFSETSYVPCNEFSSKHTLYCEQHLPNWLKRARNGKSRIISKEVFVDLLRSCSSQREEKLRLHQACDIFYKLFKSVLSLRNSVPMDVQLQWAITEASSDDGVGEFLYKIVANEKDRLTRIWGFNDADAYEVDVSVSEDHNGVLAITGGREDNNDDESKWSFGGFACAICLDSFVNKTLLESHVEERHHVQFAEKCMLLQCIPCGSHFGGKEQLLLHVKALHPSEVTVQPNDLQIVVVASQEEKESTTSFGGSVNKYECKFCGEKFSLLPDIGRHHQAEHMGLDPIGSRNGLTKKGIRFSTYRMKSGRLSRPNKFKKSLGAVSYRIRNRAGVVNMKRRMQIAGGNAKAGSSLPPPRNDFGNTDAHCSVVSDILFSKAQKAKHRPNNLDILSAARSACCRLSLETSLEGKFGVLPERVYLRAAKLCGEQGVQIQWHREGYVCSNNCKPFKDPNILCPLISRPESDRAHVATDDVIELSNNKDLEVDENHCIMEAHHFSKRPLGKTSVLCNDISFGKEPVPISCVVDFVVDSLSSEKPWESFTYVTKSMVDSSTGFVVKENVQLRCGCRGTVCSPLSCDHVYLFNSDFEEARDVYGKSLRCRFPYDDKQRIILEEGYPVYECNEQCGCSKTCQNRVLQNGIRAKLEIFRTESKGWGLRACEHILRGTFVCEYIGEVLDHQEANKRRNKYGDEDCSYIHNIDANINDIGRMIEGEPDYAIDATTHGNVSRFINHSCSPNLVTHQVIVKSMESPLAHIGLYASVDIAAGEEITRDYGRLKFGHENEHKCHCRSTNCRGHLC